MANYAPRVFRDRDSWPIESAQFNGSVVAVRSSENATASSVITMTHDTVALEITAQGGPGFLKWIRTTDTGASVVSAAGTANFDVAIPTNWTRTLVVPVEVQATVGSSNTASMVGINRREGLFQRYAYKGTASIMVNEIGY